MLNDQQRYALVTLKQLYNEYLEEDGAQAVLLDILKEFNEELQEEFQKSNPDCDPCMMPTLWYATTAGAQDAPQPGYVDYVCAAQNVHMRVYLSNGNVCQIQEVQTWIEP